MFKQLASPLICFILFIMIASLLVAVHDVEYLEFCLMGGVLLFSTTSISWTLANHIWYHPSNLYLASAYAPFYENITMLIILDHPIDYGLNQSRGPTSLGPH
jgi:hypothetical protein